MPKSRETEFSKTAPHYRSIRFDSNAALVAPLITSMALASANWKDRRAIVTGGAGFIGSILVGELNRRGCSEIVIGDFAAEGEKQSNLAGLRYSEYLEPGDLLARLASGSLGKF